jgi:hypothetical protein
MTAENRLSPRKRRTRAEVQQLVAEFVSSDMGRSEFCHSRGLSFSTLDRHLKKRRWKRRRRPVSSAGRLVKVELAARKSPTHLAATCGLAVVLPGGRRIEVHGYSDDVDQVFRSHGDQDSEAMPITDSGAWRSDRSEATLGFCIQHCTTLIQVVKQGNSKGKQSSSHHHFVSLVFAGFAGAKFAPATGL